MSSRAQAAGVIGCLMASPELRPFSPPNNLRADRMEHFWDWCSSHDHRDANLLGNQINFLMHDLHNGFARIGAKLAASETAEAAAYQVSRYFSPTIAQSRPLAKASRVRGSLSQRLRRGASRKAEAPGMAAEASVFAADRPSGACVGLVPVYPPT
jgi:hypothetical protein